DLDVSTFRFDGASHPIDYSINGSGVVTFRFDNILLPDSFVNEPASHGYIKYFIKRKLDIPLGTQITNTAYIYFDFNLPIVTNTTLNTLWDETVSLNKVNSFDFSIQPNPSKDIALLTLNGNEEIQNISITDLSGRMLYNTKVSNQSTKIQLNNSAMNLSNGIYLVNVKTSNFSKTVRWIVAGN
ncbi:MAG: T9SS type A sorting domain-containing protein, partial [Bacteroidota bacterium]